jgi:hypothetical protein
MKISIISLPLLLVTFLVNLQVTPAQEHSGNSPGMGPGMGQGHRQDMQTIHALFDAHRKITRTVKNTEDGVITLTESADPAVQALITAHAQAMKKRLEQRQPIRDWDPLFAALFENAAKIRMEVIPTERGVKIVETSADPAVVRLIQAHAAGVSEFVREGSAVMHKRHDLK